MSDATERRTRSAGPRVLLVLPPARSHYVVPPVGLGYLATALRRGGLADVRILDGQKEALTRAAFAEVLRDYRPQLVGIQAFSSGFTTVRRALAIARAELPEAVLVVGGPHVTATAARVLDDLPEADYGFVGEAEPGLPLLVEHLFGGGGHALESVPGLIRRDGGATRVNERALVRDLDGLGFPDWNLLAPERYPHAPQGAFARRFPTAPVLTSRGCPFRCTFCGSSVNMTRTYRERSVGHIMEEIELLHRRHGIREIHLIDDLFSLRRERVLEFCDELEHRRLDLSYTFPNGLRLDTLDREVLLRMKQTGAYAFTVGIESGSDRVLAAMKKGMTTALLREKIALVRDCGLEPSGFFILGFPGETREDMEATLRFARSLPLKRAHFSNFLPLPGTEATRRLLESGEIGGVDYDELSYYHVPYAPRGVTREELKRLQRRAFLSFHLRPRILLKMAGELRSPGHLRALAVRAADYLFSRREGGYLE